jgi:hypothetical protein
LALEVTAGHIQLAKNAVLFQAHIAAPKNSTPYPQPCGNEKDNRDEKERKTGTSKDTQLQQRPNFTTSNTRT